MNFSDSDLKRLSEYASESEEELTAQLADAVKRMKAQGNFDIEALERMYATLSPFLTDIQRGRMRALIDALK